MGQNPRTNNQIDKKKNVLYGAVGVEMVAFVLLLIMAYSLFTLPKMDTSETMKDLGFGLAYIVLGLIGIIFVFYETQKKEWAFKGAVGVNVILVVIVMLCTLLYIIELDMYYYENLVIVVMLIIASILLFTSKNKK